MAVNHNSGIKFLRGFNFKLNGKFIILSLLEVVFDTHSTSGFLKLSPFKISCTSHINTHGNASRQCSKFWFVFWSNFRGLFLLVQSLKVPVLQINSSYSDLIVQISLWYSVKKYKTKIYKICLREFSFLPSTNFCTFWSLYQVFVLYGRCTKKFCSFLFTGPTFDTKNLKKTVNFNF
jgi:hypothetical protein